MEKSFYTILICDDHPLVLDGLVNLIEHSPRFKVIGQTTNGIKAWELYQLILPDIVLTDIEMPGLDGIELTKKIKELNCRAKILMLTMHQEPWILAKAFAAKPDGIVSKNLNAIEIKHTIEQIIGDKTVFSPEFLEIIKSSNNQIHCYGLTIKEKEVLLKICEGKTSREIARDMKLTENTIEQYRKNLFAKLKVCNVASMVKLALEQKLI